MKYKLPFLMLFTSFNTLAQLHCPPVDTIKQTGAVYSAPAAGNEEWIGMLQGTLPPNSSVKNFSEALIIIDSDKNNIVGQGEFQKCTYNLQAQGRQIDMFYGNKTWSVSISGQPLWVYQQNPFLEIYQCSGVAAEECKFDILAPG
ncbi:MULTISPECIES: DUF3757 domain-containing protein [Yersinia]|jgi:hypothetical protein|uniref:DUF3757 domain-containing protein n=1 Tax=Yersinia intermedia TaxID=631 RepID=A0A0T9LZX7_YERIN|nr:MULTISPECIES: DUF3757 domain-containing protein [Yersinia]AJJ18576.1 hypothetical protein CH53_1322 [Yersinia intermedia]ARB83559.1 DUF3757 domain-containing protein [Yersinia sp. FDAARGOS_228]AVL37334.1 DUF3757 domain-containing protein [Yersinia intermedia]MCB5298906.1 DUF3757 domain-containing protein [Yersinia intermedia]MCW8111971.1 DUF3757 domain-containing protein [Yersinia intermedia]